MLKSVTIVTGDFVTTGGMDRANYALADYAARSGLRVQLIAHRVAPELVARPNVSWVHVPRPAGRHALGEPFLDVAGRLAGRMARADSALVVNGGNCIAEGANWVHYVHAGSPRVDAQGLRGVRRKLLSFDARRRERAALARASIAIANSRATARALIEHVGVDASRTRTVYLGIDPQQFSRVAEAEREAAKRELGVSGRLTAVFIGALGDRRKGFDTLFDAWVKLCSDADWDADLLVVGSGGELEQWRTRAKAVGLETRIRFLGFRKDVPRVLAASDLLVHPARYEPYGVGVSEALARGLAALVSKSAGIAELYPPELGSLLLEDPESAAELAGKLAAWRSQRHELGPALAQFSESMRARTWDRMAAEMLELIAS